MRSNLVHVLWLTICFFLASCGASELSESEVKEGVVTFENQSQFDIEAVYIHTRVDNYRNEPNRISTPLAPGESLSATVLLKPWYVTVVRKPNKDSSVLAYTTAEAWDAKAYRRLIYFDEQFRSSDKLSSSF